MSCRVRAEVRAHGNPAELPTIPSTHLPGLQDHPTLLPPHSWGSACTPWGHRKQDRSSSAHFLRQECSKTKQLQLKPACPQATANSPCFCAQLLDRSTERPSPEHKCLLWPRCWRLRRMQSAGQAPRFIPISPSAPN